MSTLISRWQPFPFSLRFPEVLHVSTITIFSLVQNWQGVSLEYQLPQVLLILTSVLFHIQYAFLINEYFDWGSDKKNPRKFAFKSSTALPPKSLLITARACLFSSFLLAALTQSLWVFSCLFVLNFSASLYSYPKFYLKNSIFSPLVHFICGVFYYILPLGPSHLEMTNLVFVMAWAGLLASGSLSNELVDYPYETTSGKKMLTQRLGVNISVWLTGLLHLLFLLAFIFVAHFSEFVVSSIGLFGLLIFYSKKLYRLLIDAPIQESWEQFRKFYRLLLALAPLLYLGELILRKSWGD